MVSLAAKELIKKSLNNANFHNKILEENDMWRQWELEQNLTMMVSDDAIKRRGKHLCKHHAEQRKKREEKKKLRQKNQKNVKPKSLADSLDRWDHSGFKELYPEECASGRERQESASMESRRKNGANKGKQIALYVPKPIKRRRSEREHWDHNGYKKMYRDEFSSDSDSSSCSSSSLSSSSSDSESRYRPRKRSRREKRRSPSSSSPSSSSSSASYPSASSSSTSSSRHSRNKRKCKVYARKPSSSSSRRSSSSEESNSMHTGHSRTRKKGHRRKW